MSLNNTTASNGEGSNSSSQAIHSEAVITANAAISTSSDNVTATTDDLRAVSGLSKSLWALNVTDDERERVFGPQSSKLTKTDTPSPTRTASGGLPVAGLSQSIWAPKLDNRQNERIFREHEGSAPAELPTTNGLDVVLGPMTRTETIMSELGIDTRAYIPLVPIDVPAPQEFDTFTLFPQLPMEVRLKIWQACLSEPRLIELENSTVKPYVLQRGFLNPEHHTVQVCLKSRKAPAILHVNKESRIEAEKILCQITLGWAAIKKQQPIWFNPGLDIVYFGPRTCISSVIRFGLMMKTVGISIPRVALNMNRQSTICCNWDRTSAPPNHGYQIIGGCTAMEAMHGIDPRVLPVGSPSFPGYPRLKEIFWVVRSNLWQVAPGQVGENTFLRDAVYDGGSMQYTALTSEPIHQQIEEIDQHGAPGLPGNSGPAKWVGANRPDIHFVHLTDVGVQVAGQVHDSIVAGAISEEEHTKQLQWLRGLVEASGLKIEIPNPGVSSSEVGISGGKEAVWKFKLGWL